MCWKLHLQGNVLDEIVGSIEDGGWRTEVRQATELKDGPE